MNSVDPSNSPTSHLCSCSRDEKLGRHLIGMVLCSISWWRGEWIGFTLGVALQPVVHRLLSDASLSKSLPLMPPDTSSDRLGT